jgi:copper transporter 1
MQRRQLTHVHESFRQWHIHNGFQFFLSFLAIMALGVSYEWLRDLSRRVDRKIAVQLLDSGKGKNAVSHHRTAGAIVLDADEDQVGLMPNGLKATQRFVYLSICYIWNLT